MFKQNTKTIPEVIESLPITDKYKQTLLDEVLKLQDLIHTSSCASSAKEIRAAETEIEKAFYPMAASFSAPVTRSWSACEVVDRWLHVFPVRRDGQIDEAVAPGRSDPLLRAG